MPSYSDVLIYFYESTKGFNWLRNDFWVSNFPFYRWYGLKIVEGQALEINLISNRVEGKIPLSPRLKGLSQIQILRLSCNLLSGTLDFLSYMSDLQELDLSWNAFTGVVPLSLYKCKNIRVIRLDNNRLNGVISDEMLNFDKLTYLDLSNNMFSGEFPMQDASSRLKKLKVLNLLPGNVFDGFVPRGVQELMLGHHQDLNNLEITNSAVHSTMSTPTGDKALQQR